MSLTCKLIRTHNEIKAILLQKTRWCACSATFTLLALRTVKNKVLHSNYVYIYVTSNCANTIYAVHQVVNSIDDLWNYLCFLMSLFHLGFTPQSSLVSSSLLPTRNLLLVLPLTLTHDFLPLFKTKVLLFITTAKCLRNTFNMLMTLSSGRMVYTD